MLYQVERDALSGGRIALVLMPEPLRMMSGSTAHEIPKAVDCFLTLTCFLLIGQGRALFPVFCTSELEKKFQTEKIPGKKPQKVIDKLVKEGYNTHVP